MKLYVSPSGVEHVEKTDYDALAAELADQVRITEEHQRLRYQCETENTRLAAKLAARDATIAQFDFETVPQMADRIRALEAVADERIDKIAVLAAALTKVHGIIAEYWGPCMGSIESLATIRDAIGPDATKWGPKLPQAETKGEQG